jgi:hypothetical protein
VFIRVDVVRRLSGGFGSPANLMTHRVVLGLTVIALIWFNIRRLPGARREPANFQDLGKNSQVGTE